MIIKYQLKDQENISSKRITQNTTLINIRLNEIVIRVGLWNHLVNIVAITL